MCSSEQSNAHTTAAPWQVDPPASGAWNMAVDEALLEATVDAQGPRIRFYQWREATVSLGYFQSHRARAGHLPSRQCPVVRRPSGGGAIVHDQELTYSLVVPDYRSVAHDHAAIYTAVHRALVTVLAAHGVTARLCQGADGPLADAAFLCFQRLSVGDVLVANAKIAGSAQRRRNRVLLQHGSLLLARSAAAPELPGLAELTGVHLDPQRFVQAWAAHIETNLGIDLEPGQCNTASLAKARQLAVDKYAAAAWTERH
jgi:lipoate-protein ligase A